MNRLEKKCLVASLALHALLCVILLVGPAFLVSKQRANDLPLLDMIPSRLIDAEMFNVGSPNARPLPAAPPVEQPKPPAAVPPAVQPQPDPPRPQPVERKPPPEVARAEIPKPANEPKSVTEKPKPKITVNNTLTRRTPQDVQDSRVKAEQEEARRRERELITARQRAARAIDARLNGSVRSLSENLSSGTTIEMPGTGGEAYANYSQVVKSIYDKAWIDPEGVDDDSATVQTRVVVARNGTIRSAGIVRRSGISALDKSVQEALDRVRDLPPFPEGAKESQRTFIINFNLKAKRLLG